jgi:hypothetical protein
MSAKLIALATEIVDVNPAGAQLIVNITNAETGAELVEALDNYDSAVLENYSEPVEAEYDEDETLADVDETVVSV